MKKILISISVFSLLIFSGCSLFSAKDLASEEIKTDKNIETQQEVKTDVQVLPQAEAQNDSVKIEEKDTATTTESEEAILAKCLTEKKVELYTSSTCPHCIRQKEAFKDGAPYLPNIECLEEEGWSQLCKDKEIMAVPTWIFSNGDRLTGETPLNVLAEKSGCEYLSQ